MGDNIKVDVRKIKCVLDSYGWGDHPVAANYSYKHGNIAVVFTRKVKFLDEMKDC